MPRALVLCLLLLASPPALPGPALTGEDLADIRAVIHRQIDADRGDEERGDCVVARPASVSFLDLLVIGEDVVQQVKLTDRAGAVWLAYYAMQREEDGTWRSRGCHLAKPARTISA